MPRFDFMVAATWVGLLTVVLMVQALSSWLRCRRAARYARSARRLAEAIRPERVETPAARAPAPTPMPAAGPARDAASTHASGSPR